MELCKNIVKSKEDVLLLTLILLFLSIKLNKKQKK